MCYNIMQILLCQYFVVYLCYWNVSLYLHIDKIWYTLSVCIAHDRVPKSEDAFRVTLHSTF